MRPTTYREERRIIQEAIEFHKDENHEAIVKELKQELVILSRGDKMSFKQRLTLSTNKAVKANQITYPYGESRCLLAGEKKHVL